MSEDNSDSVVLNKNKTSASPQVPEWCVKAKADLLAEIMPFTRHSPTQSRICVERVLTVIARHAPQPATAGETHDRLSEILMSLWKSADPHIGDYARKILELLDTAGLAKRVKELQVSECDMAIIMCDIRDYFKDEKADRSGSRARTVVTLLGNLRIERDARRVFNEGKR